MREGEGKGEGRGEGEDKGEGRREKTVVAGEDRDGIR